MSRMNLSGYVGHVTIQGGPKISHYQLIKKIVLNRIKVCQ